MKTYSEMAKFMIQHGGKYSYDWYMSKPTRLVAMYRKRNAEVTRAQKTIIVEEIKAEKAEQEKAFVATLKKTFGVTTAKDLTFEQKKELLRMQVLGLI